MVSPFLPDADKVAEVRAALPAVGAGIYLNTGSVGPLPAETAKAMADLADWELRVGRAHPDYWTETLARMDEARGAIAAIIAGSIGSIALTHSATDGMNLAAWAPDWRQGDRVVTTDAEHGGGLGPLTVLRDRLGVELRTVGIGAGEGAPDDDELVRRFEAAIDDRTRLVALSHVAWTTGAILPVPRIAAVARARGALVAIDGAQAVGAIPVRVADLGVDLYAISAQKWLLGPEGMGALWVAPGSTERVARTLAGHFSFERLDLDGTSRPWPDARRFESSNFHRPSIVGLAHSCGWLAMYVGLDWIQRRGPELAGRTAELLAAIPGVTLLTPRDRMANLVTIRIAGWESSAALEELGARVFAIARTVPSLDAIRFSVGFFNTEEEIERVVECVRLLATHGPDDLPARRRLVVLEGEG